MLADAGGTVTDKTGPEKGGAVRCWASPGFGKGWSYIRKVNKVSVSIDDAAAYGGRVFSRTIPFDKLTAVMTAGEVATARAEGRIIEDAEATGFFLAAPKPQEAAPEAETIKEEVEPVESQTDAPALAEGQPTTVPVESKRIDGLPIAVYGPDQAWEYPAGMVAADEPAPIESEPAALPAAAIAVPVAIVESERPEPCAEPVSVSRRFDHAAADRFRAALAAGGVKVVAVPDLFATPVALAARVVEEADIHPGDRILEPSAGTGRLIDAALLPWRWSGELVAVERNYDLVRNLVERYRGATVIHADFLECGADLGTFDRIIMNPPFENQADIKHVLHAAKLLKPGGRLVAIMSAGVTFRENHPATAFREFVESRDGTIEALPADSFKESGTGVNAVLVSFGGT